ncbi:MAG: response regulator [Anaerolineae bacterium]
MAQDEHDGEQRQPSPPPAEVPIDWLREALAGLYNNAALAGSPLCALFPDVSVHGDALLRAQAMRSLLLDSVDSLRPLRQSPTSTQAERDYEVLSLRYASGMTVERIAEQLFVSVRQVYRDLRRAEERLAEAVAVRRAPKPGVAAGDGRRAAMQREVSALQHSQQTLDVREIAAGAVSAVRTLADSLSVELQGGTAGEPLLARGTPGVLRAATTRLLSGTIQAAAPGSRVTLSLACDGGEAVIAISYVPGEATPALGEAMTGALALGIVPQARQLPGGGRRLELRLAAPLPQRVLIVEDSVSSRELYERYLEGTGWQMQLCDDAREAAAAARLGHPNAIVLDIMMPELDGWSVLQALRIDPETSAIPVIVCSVMHDPGLATALGASACLAKPVSRLELVAALRRVIGGQ